MTVGHQVKGTLALLLLTVISASGHADRPTDPASLAARVGMEFISETDMSELTAKGLQDNVPYLENVVNQTGPDSAAPETAIMATLEVVLPFLNFMSGYEITDIEYDDPSGPRTIINGDDTVSLILPHRIGAVTYNEFRVLDSNGAPLGELVFSDIELKENSQIILHKGN